MDEKFSLLKDLDTNEISFYGSLFDSRKPNEYSYVYFKSSDNDIENIKALFRHELYEFEKNKPRLYKKFNTWGNITLPATRLLDLGFTIVGKDKLSKMDYILFTSYELESIVFKHLLVDVLEETIICQLKTKNSYKFHSLLSFVDTMWIFADRLKSLLYMNEKNVICKLDGMTKSYTPENGGNNIFKGFYHDFEYEIEEHIRFRERINFKDVEYDLYTQIRRNAMLNKTCLAIAKPRGIVILNKLTEEEIKLLYELPQLLIETPYNSFNKLFFELVVYKLTRYNTFRDREIVVNGATIEARVKDLNGEFKYIDETIAKSIDPKGADKFWNYYPDNTLTTAIIKY